MKREWENGRVGERASRLLVAVLLLMLSFTFSASAKWGRVEISQQMVPFVITNSGSYVVVDDLVHSSSNNAIITISTNFVTLDLGGHQLTQMADYHAIYGTYDFVNIRNGTISLPGAGGDYAIYLDTDNNRIENIRCVGFKEVGIITDDGSLVRNCTLIDGGGALGLYGINVGSGSAVIDCSLTGFQGGLITPVGIRSAAGCLIADSMVISNDSSSSAISGIRTTTGSMILNCTVDHVWGAENTFGIEAGNGCFISDCSVREVWHVGGSNDRCITAGHGTLVHGCSVDAANNGIWLGTGALAVENTVSDADGVGINVEEGSLVRRNTLTESKIKTGDACMVAENKCWNSDSGNGVDLVEVGSHCYVLDNYLYGYADGVEMFGSYNRVDHNSIMCSTDIDAQGANNFIVRNRLKSWGVANTGDDFLGPVVIGGANMNTAEPWANIDF